MPTLLLPKLIALLLNNLSLASLLAINQLPPPYGPVADPAPVKICTTLG